MEDVHVCQTLLFGIRHYLSFCGSRFKLVAGLSVIPALDDQDSFCWVLEQVAFATSLPKDLSAGF
jgi:hypothetical protein